MQGPNYVPPSQRKPRSLSPLKDHRKNVQKLKEQVGMIYYDPRDGRYKKVTSKNGVLGFEAYDSITEIEFGKPDSGSATIEEKEKIDVFSPEIDDASA